MHRRKDEEDGLSAGSRMFTAASVRGILHNPFYAGKVKHHKELFPGSHEALVSEEMFHSVQIAMKRNSGRSETLKPRPERDYLLKGLIKCAHCGLPMWAQTYTNGRRYYREQKGSRGSGYCVDRSRSLPCHVPDDQIGQIVGAIVLPDAWMDRVLAKIHLADEVNRIGQERLQAEQRLRRLGRAYVDGLYSDDDYKREKRSLEDSIAGLVVPGVDSAKEAGELLGDLPALWEAATLSEKRRLLITMLDAVYVDTVDEKAIVAIRPKPAFRPLFEIATTRAGSGVVLINQTPQTQNEPEASESCSWWRRGRVKLPVQGDAALMGWVDKPETQDSTNQLSLDGVRAISRDLMVLFAIGAAYKMSEGVTTSSGSKLRPGTNIVGSLELPYMNERTSSAI